jgi:hypothetical protein
MARLYVQSYAQRAEYLDHPLQERLWEILEQTLATEAVSRGAVLDGPVERKAWFYRVTRDDVAGIIMTGTMERKQDWTVVQMMVTAQSARPRPAVRPERSDK